MRVKPRRSAPSRSAPSRFHFKRTDPQGSATAEIVILTPLIIASALVLLAAGHALTAQQQLGDSVQASLESASVQQSPAAASAAAASTARLELLGDHLNCQKYGEDTATGEFVAGGSVSVTIHCQLSVETLGLPGLPGSLQLSDSAAAVIEPYREVG